MARPLLAPADVEPVAIDLRRVCWIGTSAWILALLVVGLLGLTVGVPGRVVATCATGAALGLLGVAWSARRGR